MSSEARAAAVAEPHLKRALGLWDLVLSAVSRAKPRFLQMRVRAPRRVACTAQRAGGHARAAQEELYLGRAGSAPPGSCTALLGTRLYSLQVEKPSAVMHSQNVDLLLTNAIDNAVASNNDLSNVVDSQLRNHPAQVRKACQSICGADNPVGERCRHLRSVPSNESADRLQIVGRLWRPPYLTHFAIRWRTSS